MNERKTWAIPSEGDGIPIREFSGATPPGYTNWSAIYISDQAKGAQRRTLIRHEKAHIWLDHQRRIRELAKGGKPIDHKAANIAADMEIAIHIYDQADLEAITGGGLLADGILPKDARELLPDGEYMEQFYAALIAKPESERPTSHDADHNPPTPDQQDDQDQQEQQDGQGQGQGQPDQGDDQDQQDGNVPTVHSPDPAQSVAQGKERAETDERLKRCAVSLQRAQAMAKAYKPPRPSLGSELQAALSRIGTKRERSYRREARREGVDPSLATKGRALSPSAPRVTAYVDRSGSFNASKTAQSEQALDRAMAKYRGRIRLDSVYFSDEILDHDPGRGVGGTNYQCVIDAINRDRSAVSVIITDNDTNWDLNIPRGLGKILIIPIGCATTWLATKVGKEVTI